MRPASSALPTGPAGEGTITATGPRAAAAGRGERDASARAWAIGPVKPSPVRSTITILGGGSLRASKVGPRIPSDRPTGVSRSEIQNPAVRT